MRTTATVTIPVAGTTGYVVLGPFQHGSLLQAVTLFGQDPAADLTFRLGTFDRPPASAAEFAAGEQLAYPSVVPAGAGFFQLGLSLGVRMLSKRYLAAEYAFAAGLAAAWTGGLNAGVLSPVLQKMLAGTPANTNPGGFSGRAFDNSFGQL